MDIPLASDTLQVATRPRQRRVGAPAYTRALNCAVAAITKACSAGLTSTVVDVPTFVFGQPRICVDDITEYVRSCLTARGYWVVTYSGSSSIAIGWNSSEQRATGQPPQPKTERTATESIYDIGL